MSLIQKQFLYWQFKYEAKDVITPLLTNFSHHGLGHALLGGCAYMMMLHHAVRVRVK